MSFILFYSAYYLLGFDYCLGIYAKWKFLRRIACSILLVCKQRCYHYKDKSPKAVLHLLIWYDLKAFTVMCYYIIIGIFLH